ncbi:cell division protein FtsL [Paenibacillus turpanensis]|uniref:cell division protein FtsL n=1 Tax=Paenibacillus turpanensis TaxID=2689078 RepID=UPI001407C2DC|nr:cell division protein FtsL [Paenibacillus turpanensis]
MPAYVRGSVALAETEVQQQSKTKEVRKIAYRRKSLPTQEKLLYLFTIVICCVVAGVIIWRYAQIYEMGVRMQQIERDIKRLEVENNELKLMVDKLQSPERLIDAGKQLGLLQPSELAKLSAENKQTTTVVKKTQSQPVKVAKEQAPTTRKTDGRTIAAADGLRNSENQAKR